VLSPALFAIYIDDVIKRLQLSRAGCYICNMCLNAFMYADDLLLVSISLSDMQYMLDICKQEFDWLDMRVNVKKSACLRIGKRFNVNIGYVYMDNNPITWTNEFRYLGLTIVAAKTFKCNHHNSKLKFFRSINSILGKIGSAPNISVTLSLIDSHCNPILMYGMESIRLNNSEINRLSYPYNSAYMKLFNSFNNKIITLCQFYCGHLPLSHILDLRTLKFYAKLNFTNISSPASILYKWFGKSEFIDTACKYNITGSDQVSVYEAKISKSFEISIISLD
jgi:hypothetical protein